MDQSCNLGNCMMVPLRCISIAHSRYSDRSRVIERDIQGMDAGAATGVRDETELRRQHDLVAAALDGPADQFLVVVGPIDLGGVEVRDAQIQRPMNGANRLVVAAGPDVVVAGHRHGAESYARNVESADCDVLHGHLPPFCERLLLRLSTARKVVGARPPE
jgi:hypothetical protein